MLLDKPIPSPRNVPRTTDERADRQLKANIEARGLLKNLVVAPERPLFRLRSRKQTVVYRPLPGAGPCRIEYRELRRVPESERRLFSARSLVRIG